MEQRWQILSGFALSQATARKRRRRRLRVGRTSRSNGSGLSFRFQSSFRVASRCAFRFSLRFPCVDSSFHRRDARRLHDPGFRFSTHSGCQLLCDLRILLGHVPRISCEFIQALRQGNGRRALVRVRRVAHAPAVLKMEGKVRGGGRCQRWNVNTRAS